MSKTKNLSDVEVSDTKIDDAEAADAELIKSLVREWDSPTDAQTLRDLGVPEDMVKMEVIWGHAVESNPRKSLGIWSSVWVWVALATCVVAVVGAIWVIWGRS